MPINSANWLRKNLCENDRLLRMAVQAGAAGAEGSGGNALPGWGQALEHGAAPAWEEWQRLRLEWGWQPQPTE